MENIAVYIHIPFCLSKCNYCSFNSYPLASFTSSDIDKYFKALLSEIEKNRELLNKRDITSIYFGGGTPSILEADRYRELLSCFNIENVQEITLEINPGTINKKKLEEYSDIGINRVSLGIQTLNSKLLNFLGRIHSKEDAILALKEAKEVFDNFSADIIFAIPSQSIKDIKIDLSTIVDIGAKHISCYSLTVDEGSKFFKQGIKEESEDKFTKGYNFIKNFLQDSGYQHYEISNFALPSFESKHNLNYWNGSEYLGIGAGAVSFYQNMRIENINDPILYSKGDYPSKIEHLTKNQQINEYIFLNLRKSEGLHLKDFKEKYNFDLYQRFRNKIEQLRKNNLIKVENQRLFLTSKGMNVSNSIFIEFFV